MDPQHRLLLETAWHAVEHSGTAPTALADTNTGVFVGLATHDYLGMASDELTYPEIEAYMAIGTSNAAAAGRISYRLGLQGPAVAVDTACSSSLVAIHQACQALRLGECDLALAGGANVLLTPATMITFSSAHMLAPDGRCKTFDAAADGYVRGEGCGVIVIKRLEDAIRDGDRIRAVIRGSAINQDGASGGLTVPNGVAQQRVIADALERADLEPSDVGYLEAHGTGTSLGDPIEAQAAGAVLGAGREAGQPLLIGSAKTNIGHLEAAAGIAGVIKVILSLEHEACRKHLHFENPSPHIPWDRLAVQVVQGGHPWERNGRPRIAGVSSFGFAGTNAHVILEEAPEPAAGCGTGGRRPGSSGQPAGPAVQHSSALGADARRVGAGRRSVPQLVERAHPEATLADVCFTAGVGRAHLEHRAALVVNSRESAVELLGALADDRPAPGLVRGESHDTPKTAWLFTGQGSQYPGMARELFDTEPVFAETLNRCAAVVADVLEKPLLDVIFDTDSPDTRDAAADLLRAARPVRGGDGPGSALAVVGLRTRRGAGPQRRPVFGRLRRGRVQSRGRRAADGRTRPPLRQSARGWSDGRGVHRRRACREPDRRVPEPVGRRLQRCQHRIVRTRRGSGDGGGRADRRRRPVRLAGHQPRVPLGAAGSDPRRIRGVRAAGSHSVATTDSDRQPHRRPRSGRSVKLDGAYWRRHARQPVEFAKSVRTLADLNCKVLLEIGPQPVLTAAALRAWPIRPPRLGRSRPCVETPPTTDRSPKPLPTPTSWATCPTSAHSGRRTRERSTCPPIRSSIASTGSATIGSAQPTTAPRWPEPRPSVFSRTAGSRNSRPCSTVRRRPSDPGCADQACGTTQPTTYDPVHRGRPLRDPLGEIQLLRSPARTPARDPPGSSSATTPMRSSLWSTCWPHVATGTDPRLAGVRRGRGTARRRVARRGRRRSDAAHRACRGPRLRTRHRRCGHCCGCNTESWAEHGGSSAPRSPLTAHAHLGGHPWRAAGHRRGHRVAGSECLWGFGRAAALELPQVWGGLADLSTGTDRRMVSIHRPDHDTARLGPQGRPDRAARSSGLRSPAGSAVDKPSGTPLELRDDATYLVTGGLGSIGLEIAGYLAAHGAKHLVLTSRRAPAMPRSNASTRCASSTAARSASSLPTSPMRTTSHACWPPCRPSYRRWPASSMRRARSVPLR